MAHEFLGTFNRSQFERFMAFARSQLPMAPARIRHLEAEMTRLGTIIFRFDKGVPQGFAADPPESYLGKLLAAYEVLGGNPFIDLRIRLRTDPVFMIRGDETIASQYMSNGEVIGAKGLADAPTAELVRLGRSWLDDTLQGRFDRLERKIRRTVDYSDQLNQEIATLQVIQLAAETKGSLEYVASQVQQFLTDKGYRAIFDDQGKDKFGFTTYAPFSSYDVTSGGDPNVPTRTNESAQRQGSGYVGPGEQG